MADARPRRPDRSADRLLVHGGAGGVGTALLTGDLDVEVLRRAGGAQTAFDPIGDAHWRRSLAALDGAGMLIGYGHAGRPRRTAVGASSASSPRSSVSRS